MPATLLDATRCPLCGEPNRCAMELELATGQPQPPCWCTQVSFDAPLLARIPEEAKDRACVCRACAAANEGAGPQ